MRRGAGELTRSRPPQLADQGVEHPHEAADELAFRLGLGCAKLADRRRAQSAEQLPRRSAIVGGSLGASMNLIAP